MGLADESVQFNNKYYSFIHLSCQSHLESNDTGLRQGEAGEVLLALDYMLQLAPHEHASKEPGYLCEMTNN